MTVINHKSISGITSITAPAGSDNLFTVHTNDTTERFRIDASGHQNISGIITASNFKTGTTNVHSVGVEAAAINVLGADTPIGTGATIYNSGAAVFTGVVTATSFSGSGANLTSLPAQATIANNADNRVITGGSGVNLNGEANLKFDGTKLDIDSSAQNILQLNSTHSDGPSIELQRSGSALAYFGSAAASISGGTATDFALRAQGNLVLATNGGNERLRITSAGRVGVGTITPHTSYRFDIRHSADTILHLGQGGATLANMANNSWNALSFQGTNAELGLFKDSSGNFSYIMGTYQGGTAIPIVFRTGNRSESMRITQAGEVLIGGRSVWGSSNLHPNDANKVVITGPTPTDTYRNILMLEGSETSGAADTGGSLAFGGHDGSTNRNWANIWGMKENGTGGNTAGYLSFHTRAAGGNPTEKLRIGSTGVIGVNNTTPDGKGIDVSHARTNGYGATSDSRGLAHIIARNPSDAPGRFASISLVNGGGTQAEGSINLVQTANYTGDITFKSRTGATSWTEKLRIASNGQIRMNTAGTPQADLHVGGTGAALNAYFVTSRSTGAYHHYALGQSGASLGYIGSSQQISSAGQAVGFAFRSEGHIELCTGGSTEQVRLTSTGRMGVGTNAPEAALHPRANSAHGTDIAFMVGQSSSSRYFALNELSGQDNFGQCLMSFYDNSLREILTLQNTYASLANMGMGIVFRGHGGGQTGAIRAYNPSVNTTSGSVLHLTSENNNSGLKISSSQVTVVGSVLQVANFQIRDGGFSGTWDTGITVNQSNAGGVFIFMCCKNWDANDSTASGMYLVRCGYSGNQEPQVWHVSGNNSWTISRNTSNHTLQINGGSGNNRVTILWTT